MGSESLSQTQKQLKRHGKDTAMNQFQHKIDCSPDYAILTVEIPEGETLKVEASAMASMDTNIKMKTKMKGGFKRLFTGESLFINEFTAEGASGQIQIAPGPPGDMRHAGLNGTNTIFLQNSAYVASSPSVILDTKWQGMMKGFFSGESFFLIKCSGEGDLFFNSYGGIIEIDVSENYIVDTGCVVAFEETLDYSVRSIGGMKSLFFSGEGLVCEFKGTGRLWIQTRNVPALTGWINPFRPTKKSSGD